MAKRKRKLTPTEKAERERRRRDFQTILVNGRMKRVRRPPMIDGLTVDEFIRRNADPIFLHRDAMWEYVEPDIHLRGRFRMRADHRESVSFITTETGDDLIVAYAIGVDDSDDVLSLILQRTPRFDTLLPPEDRGVAISHEGFADSEREMLLRVIVRGSQVDFHSTVRRYKIDLSRVDPEELAEARAVLVDMHRFGGFDLDLGLQTPG